MNASDQAQRQMLFERLFASSPDAIVVVDHQGRILEANPRTESLFGYAGSELVGSPVEILMSERFRSVHPSHRGGYSSQPRMRPMGTGMELFGKRRDGSEFPVDIMLSPVETPEGRFVLSVIRDVTERKRLEQEMQRLLSESQMVARIGSWNLEIASNRIRWSAETYRIYGVSPESFHPSPESLLG